MNYNKVKRSLPCYKDSGVVIFDESHLPPQAKQQDIKCVFRVCRKGCIDANAFLCSYSEGIHNKDLDLNDSSSFSTSCYEKLGHAKRFLKCIKKWEPTPIIAQGYILKDSGYTLRDKDKPDPKGNSHVDWWIFEDEHPENYFVQLEDE